MRLALRLLAGSWTTQGRLNRDRARSSGQTRTLVVTQETYAKAMTCMSAGRNRRVGSGHDDEVERNSKIIGAARAPIFCVIRSWGRAYLLAAVRSLIRCRPGTSWGTCWR